MAERRMFAKSVVSFDTLPELSHSAQTLYFHLNMHADDDGLIGNPKPVMRLAQCTEDDLQALEDCGLVMALPSGAAAISHWRVHNQIRRDRYRPTRLRKDFDQLVLTAEGTYRLRTPEDGCQSGNQRETQDRLVKSSLVQSILDKEIDVESIPPTADCTHSIDTFDKAVYKLYQECCPSLLNCGYLSIGTRKRIDELRANGWTLEALKESFTIAEQTPFLCGKNDRGWIAGLDWLCVDDNLRKLNDGRYSVLDRKNDVPKGGSPMGEAELEAIQKLLADNT